MGRWPLPAPVCRSAPASGKAAVTKEHVQASSSAKAKAEPGEADNG
ncbi:hypothetical protein ACQKEG_20020, partial [Klebsiella quasipneumoniae]